MTNLALSEKTEREIADKLAEKYRREGYVVTRDPGIAELPFELGQYRPDLLVRKDQGGFLIEVRTRADRLSVEQLSSVVDEVRRHPGWRFLLVTGQDIAPEALPDDYEEAVSWDDVARRLSHARRLFDLAEYEASFLILWISFEQLLRLHARESSVPVDRLSPSIMIKQLYSLGELSLQQFDLAMECQRTRNQLVHGLRVSGLNESINKLMELVGELFAEWSGSHRSV